MAASGLQEIVTEVADLLGYCLKAKQKKPYFPLLMGKTYSSLSVYWLWKIPVYRNTKTLHKNTSTALHTLRKSTPTAMHTLCNNSFATTSVTQLHQSLPWGRGRFVRLTHIHTYTAHDQYLTTHAGLLSLHVLDRNDGGVSFR